MLCRSGRTHPCAKASLEKDRFYLLSKRNETDMKNTYVAYVYYVNIFSIKRYSPRRAKNLYSYKIIGIDNRQRSIDAAIEAYKRLNREIVVPR